MRVKVLGAERRRRWSYDEKVRLVDETLQAGETVCGIALAWGAPSLLFTWRRQARQGRPGGDAVPVLVPVEIIPAPAPISISAPQPRLRRLRSVQGLESVIRHAKLALTQCWCNSFTQRLSVWLEANRSCLDRTFAV